MVARSRCPQASTSGLGETCQAHGTHFFQSSDAARAYRRRQKQIVEPVVSRNTEDDSEGERGVCGCST